MLQNKTFANSLGYVVKRSMKFFSFIFACCFSVFFFVFFFREESTLFSNYFDPSMTNQEDRFLTVKFLAI